MTIQRAHTDQEIADCFPVMQALRTHLDKPSFVPLVRGLMQDGYQLAYLRENEEIVCVAGFKIATSLTLGKHLYVEDLSTLERAQSTGHGALMMAWLRNLAHEQGCLALNLDSGVQRHRAHKFYLNQNMRIVYYHFLETFE